MGESTGPRAGLLEEEQSAFCDFDKVSTGINRRGGQRGKWGFRLYRAL